MSETFPPLPPSWAEQDPCDPYPGYFDTDPHAWVRHHRDHRKEAIADAENIRIVFLGDSITQGWDTRLWYEHFAPLGAVNFGIGGDRTCQLLWRTADGLLDGLSPRLFVVKIGVNNLWQGDFPAERIAEGIGQVIAALRAKCPEAKILALGILPAMQAADHPLRAKIRAINALTAAHADGKTVHFMDIGGRFLEPDGSISPTIMPAFVHLTFEGYQRFADADPAHS